MPWPCCSPVPRTVKIWIVWSGQGQWAEAKKVQKPMGSIYGQTLGIVGCGAIGRMTARKSTGLRPESIRLWSVCREMAGQGERHYAHEFDWTDQNSPDAMFRLIRLDDTSFHMMGEKEFRQMKRSAYFINTFPRQKLWMSRLWLRRLRRNGLPAPDWNVYENEPVTRDNPLIKFEKSLCCRTPRLTLTLRFPSRR